MKHTLSIVFYVLTVMSIIISCQKQDLPKPISLSLDTKSIQIAGNFGSVDSFKITATGSWQIIQTPISSPLLILNTTSGTGNKTIYYRANSVNLGGQQKKGKLEVSLTNEPQSVQTIDILQDNSNISSILSFGGQFNDVFYDAAPTSDSGQILVGLSNSTSGDLAGLNLNGIAYDLLIVKIDKNENVIWKKLIGGMDTDVGLRCIPVGNDFLIAGNSGSSEAPFNDPIRKTLNGFLMKIDKNGNILWNKVYGSSASDSFSDMALTPDNNIILAGNTAGQDGDLNNDAYNVNYVPWIIKTDQSGRILWSKTLNTTNASRATSVAIGTDGNIYITGELLNTNKTSDFEATKNSYDIFTAKLSKDNGSLFWSQILGGTKEDLGVKAFATQDNGVMIVGKIQSTDIDQTTSSVITPNLITAKYDRNGNKIWLKNYDSLAYVVPQCGAQLSNDSYLIGGYKSGPNYDDAWIMQINNQGNIIKNEVFGGNANDNVRGLRVGNTSTIYAFCAFASTDFPGVPNKGSIDALVVKLKW
jgi:hypothetical protein